MYRNWEYARCGDYHRNLDPNWSYTPTYLRKMNVVRQYINSLPLKANIIDIGCGEGILVEEFQQQGRHIQGIDANYASQYVQQGDVRRLPFVDCSFDAVLFLDVLEQLAFVDQPKAIDELSRILSPSGTLLLSVPNLAHFNSRIRFFFKGNLDRTDNEIDHHGERPIKEYITLITSCGFDIIKTTGITLTVPYLYRRVICRHPAQYRWLHDLFEPFAYRCPSLAMLTVFYCQKSTQPAQCDSISDSRKEFIIHQSEYAHIFSVKTHLTDRERWMLCELGRNIVSSKPTVVEIGSYLGASTCFLATGIRQKHGKVYAVDTWQNQGMSEGERDTYTEFLQNIEPLKDAIVPLKGTSTTIAKTFFHKIDLLFIDGDHSYEGCLHDWQAWSPFLNENAIVVFHDVSWSEGVQRVIQEEILPRAKKEGRLPNLYWAWI